MPENEGWIAKKIDQVIHVIKTTEERLAKLIMRDRQEFLQLKNKLNDLEQQLKAMDTKIDLILGFVSPPPPPPLPVAFVVKTEIA